MSNSTEMIRVLGGYGEIIIDLTKYKFILKGGLLSGEAIIKDSNGLAGFRESI